MWTLLLMLPLLYGTGVIGYNYQTDYMSHSCGSSISLYDYGYISWSDSGDYGNNEDCTVVFFAHNPNSVISLQFLEVNIESCIDHLYIYDGEYYTTSFLIANEDICNNNIPSGFISTGNYITLRLTSDGSVGGTFRLMYTLLLRPASPTSSCSADYFHCSNGYCISSALQCDTILNCPDGGDENCATRLRLVGGSGAHEGRLEVRPLGSYSWGTVCDDEFDTSDADVACRMLGYSEASEVRSSAYFGEGSGDIYMDDLRCSGDESSLFHCTYAGWGVHNCGHHEDVGIVCASTAAGLSIGEIAGIVVGVLTGIVVLLLIVHNCNKTSSNSSPSSRVAPNRVSASNTMVQGPTTVTQNPPPKPPTVTQAPLPPIPTANQPPPPPQQFPPPPAYSAALAMPAQAPGGTTPYTAPSPNQDPAYAPQPPQGAQLHPSPAVLYPPPDSSVPPPPHYLPPLVNAPQLPPAY
ncbi:scavenger receptor [Branchiostoma belcheri]|nr:scavenger receptor [Branchiostoma belcheri]